MAFTGQRNYGKIQGALETTDATVTTMSTYTVSVNSVGEIDMRLTWRDNVSGEIGHGRKVAKFKRVSGVLSIVSTIIDLIAITIDGINLLTSTFTIDVSGDDLRVRVTGVAGRTVHWQGIGEIIIN